MMAINKPYYLLTSVGLFVLALLIVILAVSISFLKIPFSIWLIICGIWFWIAIGTWKEYYFWGPKDWLILAGESILYALLWCGIFRIISYLISHFFFKENEPIISKVFDFGVALLISPGITFISIAGAVRAFIKNKVLNNNSVV